MTTILSLLLMSSTEAPKEAHYQIGSCFSDFNDQAIQIMDIEFNEKYKYKYMVSGQLFGVFENSISTIEEVYKKLVQCP